MSKPNPASGLVDPALAERVLERALAHGGDFAQLARTMFETVDRAHRDMPGGPPEQVEIQVDGGTVYGSRTPQWMLAVVARRAALSSLMLMDLRAVLGELEGGPPIRRSTPASEQGAPVEATEEAAAGESPVPELGVE